MGSFRSLLIIFAICVSSNGILEDPIGSTWGLHTETLQEMEWSQRVPAMAVQEPRPNHTIDTNNLNEEINKDGFGHFGLAQSPHAGPGLRHAQGDEQCQQRPALHAGLPLLRQTHAVGEPPEPHPVPDQAPQGEQGADAVHALPAVRAGNREFGNSGDCGSSEWGGGGILGEIA
ncbi:uncharacterized protein LOC130266448 isoform X2 [Oenanthe melanoleuca]|uniref:uncharacterized protein LOC130266448 isoform X2 n=1 Tax=Oenanthe melanoleuca TaxID=2939378 RepID=UPI0024C1193C|nr:uncharacterized protein LOC130266448 isoform X2 [Oenanthe melanoleuca]